jgi:hypothetical protein
MEIIDTTPSFRNSKGLQLSLTLCLQIHNQEKAGVATTDSDKGRVPCITNTTAICMNGFNLVPISVECTSEISLRLYMVKQ